MLTAIPLGVLHRARLAGLLVAGLAELGLALLCPCDDDHGIGAEVLELLGRPRQ